MQPLRCLAVAYLIVISASFGCNRASVFPREALETALRGKIPAYVSIGEMEVEATVDANGRGQANFKVALAPKEDLYVIDRKVDGTPVVTLLRLSQRAGEKSCVYGVAEVSKIVDHWIVDNVRVQSGMQRFGDPIGSFGAEHYVAGSQEADRALKLQADNAKAEERKRKQELAEQARRDAELREERERQEREAREKIAKLREEEKARQRESELREERRQIEEAKKREAAREEKRQKVLLATAPGVKYSGTISNQFDQREKISMQFKDRNSSDVEVLFFSPADRRKKRIFKGQIVFNPKPEIRLESTADVYPNPNAPRKDEAGASDYFYFHHFYSNHGGEIQIVLEVTETGGLQGGGGKYSLSLERETNQAKQRGENKNSGGAESSSDPREHRGETAGASKQR
ncbi:MAG: hypothetical protein ABFD16_00660 [Thermoguttaceae bacterium]